MKNSKNKVNRGFIVLNKGERIAVISLLAIIAISMAFSVFRPALRFSKEDTLAFHNLDSLLAIHNTSDPNESPGEEPTTPVITPPQSTSNATGKPSSPPSKPTKTPSKASPPQNSSNTLPTASGKIPILDLNRTDSVALVVLPQIGEVMASRIQRYRDRLGGFVCFEQLYEIKGMDTTRFATVRPYLQIDTTDIRKLEVNRDEFKTLLRHPYLEYEQVKAIVNYRERKGFIRNWEQLKGIVGEVNPLLERYVKY